MDINNLSKRALELWNGWELRSLILLSLFLQILLIIIGNRRKYSPGILLGIFVWSAYLSADWVATFALGIASRSQGDGSETIRTNPNPNFIPAFWAPILLVHLGGPDTITAYALEDNELWLRHLLQLAIQTAAASYALFKSWGKDPLILIAIPVFVSGIIKYGERIWVLWLASSKKFRASENEEMDTLQSKIGKQFPSHDFVDLSIEDLNKCLELKDIKPEAVYLHEAHLLFQMFKILFADLALSHSSHMASYHILSNKDATEAFRLIEVELGFMYDLLFTKMTRVSLLRTILRSISFLSSTSALVAFSLMIVNNCAAFQETEVIISYFLLGGGVVLEIYAVIMLLLSDWAMYQLSLLKRTWTDSVYSAIYCNSIFDNEKRWERSMAQHDLADAQIKKNGDLWTTVKNSLTNLLRSRTPKEFLMKLLGKGNIQKWEVVSSELKQLIFNYLKDKRLRYSHQMPHPDPGMNDLKEILAERGDQVLRREGCFAEFGWTVVDFDFHATLLLWHVATDICYWDDRKNGGDAHNFPLASCKLSRSLSNYMLYLLSECLSMLPKGIGEVRYKQTGIQLTEFCSRWRTKPSSLTELDSQDFLNEIRKHESNVSVLQDACKLAKALQSLGEQNGWTNKRKWEMISEIWVEMLTYAAGNCGWREHAQALTHGGELLTRVCLLMAHLGLNEQCLTSDQKASS